MAKQAVLLFVRALIIGVILNLGIQYASGNSATIVTKTQQVEQILSVSDIQTPVSTNPGQ